MVGIVLAAAIVFQIRIDRSARVVPSVQTANTGVPLPVVKTPATEAVVPQTPGDEFGRTARDLNDQEPVATGMILSSASPVDASLRDNLKKVNEFIAECERHLKEQPQDELTREYLSAAYQQKAELLSAMIERGRSIN
jgi:hypothetical protein